MNQPLANPYQDRTKGEMLSQCRNQPLLQELFPRTVSCSRPVVSRWQRRPAGSCGYCYPCLMRRAALHRLGWDDGGHYLLDVLAAPETLRHRTRGRDLRALLLAHKTWEDSPAEITGPPVAGRHPGRSGGPERSGPGRDGQGLSGDR